MFWIVLNCFEWNYSKHYFKDTYFCLRICSLMYIFMKFMSFSQGLISGLYGGMKIQGTYFFMKNCLTATVLWKWQLSATITIFSILWSLLFSNFINSCFKNTKYLFGWMLIKSPLSPLLPPRCEQLWSWP